MKRRGFFGTLFGALAAPFAVKALPKAEPIRMRRGAYSEAFSRPRNFDAYFKTTGPKIGDTIFVRKPVRLIVRYNGIQQPSEEFDKFTITTQSELEKYIGMA